MYIMAIALTFAACSSDDDANENGTLLGKWNYNQVSATINGEIVVGNYPGNEEGCPKDFLIFAQNGTVVLTDYTKDNTECQTQIIEGTYAAVGTNVSVAIDGGTFSGQITKLTSTTMIVLGTLGELENVTFSFER